MSRNAKRRLVIMIGILAICIAIIVMTNVFDEKTDPAAYEYYIRNTQDETNMPNAVTAIYLQYRIFDTLFEALLLSVAVSAVVYFAAEWEKEEGKSDNE